MGLLLSAASKRGGGKIKKETILENVEYLDFESNSFSDAIFKQIEEGLMLIDPQGVVIRSNLDDRQLLPGEAPQTLDALISVFIESNRFELRKGMDDLLSGQMTRFSSEGETTAGFWLRIRAKSLRDSNGQINQILIFLVDLSDSLRADWKKAADEQTSDDLMNAITDTVLRFSASGTLVDKYIHEEETNLFLIEPQIGDSLKQLFGDQLAIDVQNHFDGIRRDGRMRQLHFQVTFTGTLHYYEMRLLGVSHDNMMLLIRNVDRLQSQMNSLQKSHELFRVTIRSLVDGVIITDKKGQIQDLNEAVTSMIGVTLDQAAGHPFWEVIRPRTEGWDDHRKDLMNKVFQQRTTAEIEEGIDVVAPSGDIRVLTLYYSPIMKSSESVLWGGVLILRDVTTQYDWKNKVKFLSFNDRLTGLYNRSFFEEEVRRLEREETFPLSVINMDMNGLKLANDGFGHEEGDRLLKQLAMVLQIVCRRDDLIVRSGGDEFSVILPQANQSTANEVLGRIQQKIEEMNDGESIIPLSVSAGVASLNQGESPQAMFNRADEEMYKQKLEGRQEFRESVFQSLSDRITHLQFDCDERLEEIGVLARRFGVHLGLKGDTLTRVDVLARFARVGSLEQRDLSHSDETMGEAERNAVVGYRIALTLPQLTTVAEDILAFGERWDGQGVPRGYKGEAIPLLSRIVNIVHAYFFAKGDEAALEAVLDEKGKTLDPSLVDNFLAFLKKES